MCADDGGPRNRLVLALDLLHRRDVSFCHRTEIPPRGMHTTLPSLRTDSACSSSHLNSLAFRLPFERPCDVRRCPASAQPPNRSVARRTRGGSAVPGRC
jgi:hypothetical protein